MEANNTAAICEQGGTRQGPEGGCRRSHSLRGEVSEGGDRNRDSDLSPRARITRRKNRKRETEEGEDSG